MGKVVVDISMSLDGYVAAPGADLEHGLGMGGDVLHAWVCDDPMPADAAALAATYESAGAVVMGRRTFDAIDGPHGWSDDVGSAGDQDAPSAPPCFVVTHRAPATVRLARRFTFVTDGLTGAVTRAQRAAGGKDVVVMGGGELAARCLAAGLVDELRLHVAPVLLGDGASLFQHLGAQPIRLEVAAVVASPRATHLTYRVLGRDTGHSSD